MGLLGLPYTDFYALTPRSFENLLRGWKRKDEAEMRERWEMHRELIVTLSRPHLKKQHASKTTQQLYSLPWDEKPVKNKAPEDPVAFWKKIDNKFKK